MKGLEGTLFRPQGKPMAFPYTVAAKLSQFPYRWIWHEMWQVRFFVYSTLFLSIPAYYQLDKKLTSKENTAYWREKRMHDIEHIRKEREAMWEIRT